MADRDELPLARALAQIKDTCMRPHEVSAFAQVVCGLSALGDSTAPIPLNIINEWRGLINSIETSRRPPGKILLIYEDGLPG